jgi:putative addiction module antidote
MITLKVTTGGASEGLVLDKEARLKLGVKNGDTLYLTDAPGGGLRIAPYNPDFARQMELAEQLMHDDREVLRALAE